MSTTLPDTELSPESSAAPSNGSVSNGSGSNGSNGTPGGPGKSGGNGNSGESRKRREQGRKTRRPVGPLDVLFAPGRLVMRLLFPKLVDRYMIGELIGPLIFGWTMFIVLFVFSLNMFKLAQFLARGAELRAVAEMLGLRIILSSVYCLPMAMLLAGLLAFGRLSGDSELIASQAGGIPNIRPIWIAFLIGLILSFVGLGINEFIIPPAGQRLHFVEEQVKVQIKGRVIEDLSDQKAFVIQDMEGKRLARLVIARKFFPANPPYPATMQDVTYIQYDERREWTTIVQAERAEWVEDQKWRFYHADQQFRAGVTKGKGLHWYSETTELVLKKTPKQAAEQQKDADQMSYRDLRAYIQQLKADKVKGRVIREFTVQMEQKLAVPFAAMVFALIGAPLGIRRQRSTAGVGIGLSLLIIIIYYMGMSALGVMGENGQLSPLHAAWGCNLVGLIVGLYLTWRAST